MQLKNNLQLLGLSLFSVAFMSWTINKIESVSDHYNSEVHYLSETTAVSNPEPGSSAYVYDSLSLEEKGLSHEAFDYAIQGFEKLMEEHLLQNDSILTIIDFDQPSYKKRLYVIDVRNYKVLFNTLVAHGKNTGKEEAVSFSNAKESNKSSLGFYLTDVTYTGSKGYSLKLRGLEKNINSNAFARAIVMHGARYVSQSLIDEQGYIGRSLGCPAVPVEWSQPIIQTIKNGSCLFIYNKSYKPSSFLQNS